MRRENSGRGVAYWTDGTRQEIFFITPGFQLVALDAKTGTRLASFGDQGVVDLKKGMDREVDPIKGAVGSSSPPIISHNVVVVGSALLCGHCACFRRKMFPATFVATMYGRESACGFFTPSRSRASSATTPGKAARGNIPETPEHGLPCRKDDELGYVYIPVESAHGDTYAGHRLGNNLFDESLVCLDIKTGKRIWYYQMVHHGIWDYDLPAAHPGGHNGGWKSNQGGSATNQAGVCVCIRSRDGEAHLADRATHCLSGSSKRGLAQTAHRAARPRRDKCQPALADGPLKDGQRRTLEPDHG